MNKQQIEEKAREFYWRRNPKKMIAENTRPDLVVGYVQGFNEAASMMYSEDELRETFYQGVTNMTKVMDFNDLLKTLKYNNKHKLKKINKL